MTGTGTITVDHISGSGTKTKYVVPDGTPEREWNRGVLVGPPDLTDLGLSKEVTVRLHNELFNRGIIRKSDARGRRADVHAALQAALRIDADIIIQIFEEYGNG